MLRKIKEWFQQDVQLRSCSQLELYQEIDDPRELPRPDKIVNKFFKSSATVTENKQIDKATFQDCKCNNCQEITENFSECVVCMEPLQCVAICSCMFCGNYTCWRCSEKVVHCPFCRINFHPNINRLRNFALERVLLKLELPCRYARCGCKVLLNHKERSSHEIACPFAPISCPLVKICSWQGEPQDIIRHLKENHKMALITSTGVNIEITNFRTKLLNTITVPQLYTVSLACYGNVYICKLKMLDQKLRMIFYQITGEKASKEKKFRAWMEIWTISRTIHADVEISSKYKKNKEIIIPGQALIYSTKEGDDLVKIGINIKPY